MVADINQTLSAGDIEILKAAKNTPPGKLLKIRLKDKMYGSVLEAGILHPDQVKPGVEYYDPVGKHSDGTSHFVGIRYRNEPRGNVPQSKP